MTSSAHQDRFLPLQPQEHHPERSFADPAHNLKDLWDLVDLRDQLLKFVLQGQTEPHPPTFMHVFHRSALLNLPTLAFVGFRSILKPDIPAHIRQELTDIDARLVQHLKQDPTSPILSYSSKPLDDHNWLNLVVLCDPSALGYWQHSPHHQRASQHLAPHCYQGIRLHNGTLNSGIQGPLQIHSTRYYDFSGPQPWFAIRNTSTSD